MKVPKWFSTALEKIGKDILAGHIERDEAEVSLHDQITDSVGIGRMAHQSVMTGKDWDNALAFYANRLEHAEIGFKAIKNAYEEVRPFLVDETTTTADVADKVIEQRGRGRGEITGP